MDIIDLMECWFEEQIQNLALKCGFCTILIGTPSCEANRCQCVLVGVVEEVVIVAVVVEVKLQEPHKITITTFTLAQTPTQFLI